MAKLTLLDPTKTGRPAQDLESKLRRFVVGQEEAIHEIVRTYQTHLTGLSPAGRPIGNFLFLVLLGHKSVSTIDLREIVSGGSVS